MITLEIVNTNIEKNVNLNIENIVNNHIDYIVFSDILDKRSVALEYIEVPEITAKKNLKINDLSWSKPGNNVNYYKSKDSIFFTDRYSFTINSKDALITHKTIFDNEGNVLPLFYKHKTKSGKRILSVELKRLSKGKKNIQEQGFFFDDKEGIVYTNYKNHFNFDTFEYDLFFLNGIDFENNSFSELLNPEPVIKELSWEDIDPETGYIKKNYFCFQREKNELGKYFYFDILTSDSKLGTECSEEDSVKGFYVKALESNVIRIKETDSFGIENPWHLKISNSETFLENSFYKISEYNSQPFFLEAGYIQLLDKDCYYIENGIIKLPVETPRIDPENNFHFNLYVLDTNSKLEYFYSTNDSLIGSFLDNVECKPFEYITCDSQSGVVSFSPSVLPNQKLKADFVYYSKDYIYTDLDFNPINNSRVRENVFVLYMKPFTNLISKSIYYLELDYKGTVINTNDLEKKEEWIALKYDEIIFPSENLLLGEIKLLDSTKEKELFNFDLKKYDFMSEKNFKDAILKNPKILQSKFGYGEKGMLVKKNNLMLINIPFYILEEFGGDYFFQKETDTNFNKKFSLKNIERLIRSRIPQDIDLLFDISYRKSKLKIEKFGNFLNFNYSWEGPGVYKIIRKTSLLETAYEVFKEKAILERPIPINGIKDQIIDNINLNADTNKYYYAIMIDDEPASNFVSVSD